MTTDSIKEAEVILRNYNMKFLRIKIYQNNENDFR